MLLKRNNLYALCVYKNMSTDFEAMIVVEAGDKKESYISILHEIIRYIDQTGIKDVQKAIEDALKNCPEIQSCGIVNKKYWTQIDGYVMGYLDFYVEERMVMENVFQKRYSVPDPENYQQTEVDPELCSVDNLDFGKGNLQYNGTFYRFWKINDLFDVSKTVRYRNSDGYDYCTGKICNMEELVNAVAITPDYVQASNLVFCNGPVEYSTLTAIPSTAKIKEDEIIVEEGEKTITFTCNGDTVSVNSDKSMKQKKEMLQLYSERWFGKKWSEVAGPKQGTVFVYKSDKKTRNCFAVSEYSPYGQAISKCAKLYNEIIGKPISQRHCEYPMLFLMNSGDVLPDDVNSITFNGKKIESEIFSEIPSREAVNKTVLQVKFNPTSISADQAEKKAKYFDDNKDAEILFYKGIFYGPRNSFT